MACDNGAWGLWFATGTWVLGGCLEEHLIDREGALGRAGRRSRVWARMRVPWGREGGLKHGMGRWEMGAALDIDIEAAT